MQDGSPGMEWLTLAEAAARLHVSVDTMRRRLKAGQFEARQVTTRHGLTWQVRLGTSATVGSMPTHDAQGSQESAPPVQGDPAEGSAAALELVRLVGRLQEENRTLAGQVGYLQAQLEAARDEVRALSAPEARSAAQDAQEPQQPRETPQEPTTPQDAPTRPWWAFWRS